MSILSVHIAISGGLLSSHHIFAFSHRSRSTKHERISSRCASSQKEKGAAAVICIAVRAVRVQTIRLETVSREWNEGRLFHCRIIRDELICLPFGAALEAYVGLRLESIPQLVFYQVLRGPKVYLISKSTVYFQSQ